MATAKKTTRTTTTTRKTATSRAATTKPKTTRTSTKPKTTRTSTTKVSASVKADQRSARLGPIELITADVRTLATDTVYATVGAGDRAIAVARELPQRLDDIRKHRVNRTTSVVKNNRLRAEGLIKDAPDKAQSFVKDVPTKLQAEVSGNFETARKELDSFATRGREVVEAIAKAPTTKRALSQTETARSQVKGAITSIRKAVEQGQEAVEGAVDRIGVRRSA